MPLVVGIDEAGYGPLLGPLVVGATVWQVTPHTVAADFWDVLRAGVSRRPERGDRRVAVGDSKKIFNRKKGLASLERPVLAFARAAGLPCGTVGEFLTTLRDAVPADDTAFPWYGGLERPLPTAGGRAAFTGAAAQLRNAMSAGGARCCGLMAQIVTETAFNRRVLSTRNKAAVLLEQVLRLVQRAAAAAGGGDLHVHVDRLGGRSNYRTLLLAAFPERHLHELEQSNRRSCYRLAAAENDWFVDFSVEADQTCLPVALASMLAKYVRELLMERFNAYWRQWLPTLRPTAGYYSDALRFLRDIEPVVRQAGILPERFVRKR
ncbi:MAG: hypothetical protein KKB50_09805 [Planctomycetes bacterium]|nr:hypothetical protein [Planctomycetota bacterium]